MIYNILREKPTRQVPIVISLDELCQIWIPYNNSFQSPSTVEETANTTTEAQQLRLETGLRSSTLAMLKLQEEAPLKAETDAPVEAERGSPPDSAEAAKRNIELHKFYDEVIQPNNDMLADQGITEGINKVIKLLDKYGDCSSIVAGGVGTGNGSDPEG